MPKNTVIAIDIRSSRIVVLAGKLNTKNEIEVIWFSESEYNILADGLFSNEKRAAAILKAALSDLRRCLDPNHISVICNYPGIERFVKQKTSLTMEEIREISALDLAQLYELKPFPREHFIYSTDSSFTVDEINNIRDPVGMIATRIEADLTMVSVKNKMLKKLANCFAATGVSIENYYPSSIADSYAVLYQEQIQDESRSFVVINTGSGLTRISIVQNGRIDNSSHLKMGGNTITQAICDFTGLDFQQAETLKISRGSVEPDKNTGSGIIPLNSPNGYKGIPLKEDQLAKIIHKSAERLIDLAWREAEALLAWNRLPDSIILTGSGITKFKGIEELVKRVTRQKCRIGKPGIGLSNSSIAFSRLNSPEYASSVGLLRVKLQ